MKLLVLGGTGFVGRALAALLVARAGGAGVQIVVPSRRPQRHKALASLPGVQLVAADVHDPAVLVRLLAGSDAVVNLVAILHGSAAAFERTHVMLPRTLAQACQQAGVRRVVHVSALGISAQPPSNYLRSKAAGEAVLTAAGLDLTLLRPSVIFGAEDRFLNLFATMQKLLPLVPLAGAQARFQPVWVEDVVRAIAACLDDPSTIGATIECAGPRVYTLADLVRLAGEWAGAARPILPLPDAVARLQASAMALLPGEPLLSADNLDSMREPNIASGALPGLERLGIAATALEAVAPGYLASLGTTRLDALRAAVRRR